MTEADDDCRGNSRGDLGGGDGGGGGGGADEGGGALQPRPSVVLPPIAKPRSTSLSFSRETRLQMAASAVRRAEEDSATAVDVVQEEPPSLMEIMADAARGRACRPTPPPLHSTDGRRRSCGTC